MSQTDKNLFLQKLCVPSDSVDVVLDTDAYNEIDDQFAIAYLLKSKEKLTVKGIYAAPFFNENSCSPGDGMEKSYSEILKLLELSKEADKLDLVYRGASDYLPDEHTPVHSPAAEHLVRIAKNYTPEKPLYVIGIAAITNIASALLLDPSMKDRIVVVWLGGNSYEFGHTHEFNMQQDIAAVRAVLLSGVPFVQLPCMGVVSTFTTTEYELKHFLQEKNELCDYLLFRAVEAGRRSSSCRAWSRVIWDVTAVGWLLNDNTRFMLSRVENVRLPSYDGQYEEPLQDRPMAYVYYVIRDDLFEDLFRKLSGSEIG